MKCLVILFTFLLAASSYARQERQILKCLGEEEKKFHLNKETGPLYDLNQRLISEMVQIPKVEIRDEAYLDICTGPQFSRSWKLLDRSIREGKSLFVIPDKVEGMEREITLSMIDDYVEATREILLSFISQIQTHSPTPQCLKEEIPELDAFFTEIKYLQEDVDMAQIFKGKDQRVVEKLKNYPLAFEKCRARLKKKAKSPSTEAPKKS